jgi:hypothetical protein
MAEQIQNNLSFYVTSSFAALPLTGTTSILSGIIGGVIKLPIAKFVDLIGRAEGFAIMTGIATIGMGSIPMHKINEAGTNPSRRSHHDGRLP